MYEDYESNSIRRTVVSFDSFLKREDVRSLTDAQVGKKFGLATQTVKAMRRHLDVPFETIQILCHQLECQPGGTYWMQSPFTGFHQKTNARMHDCIRAPGVCYLCT